MSLKVLTTYTDEITDVEQVNTLEESTETNTDATQAVTDDSFDKLTVAADKLRADKSDLNELV